VTVRRILFCFVCSGMCPPCYAKSSYRLVDPPTPHGNVHQVDHMPNRLTNSAAITTILPLWLCGGKLLVAFTWERHYGLSRLRVDDDANNDSAFHNSAFYQKLLKICLETSKAHHLHLYADDIRHFLSFIPTHFNSSTDHLHNALDWISSWKTANLLTLNSPKTEFLLTGLSKQLLT